MTYQPYPSAGGSNQMPPAERGAQPSALVNAVRLMWAGAALALIGAIVTLAFASRIKDAVRKAALKSNATAASRGRAVLTSAQIHTVENATVIVLAVLLLVGVLLWVWMAWANNRGRNWARIVGTVLFGLNTISLIFSFGRTSISIIFVLLGWLVGLGAVVLLWRKETTAYFNSQRI
jgi:hypothetical protein